MKELKILRKQGQDDRGTGASIPSAANDGELPSSSSTTPTPAPPPPQPQPSSGGEKGKPGGRPRPGVRSSQKLSLDRASPLPSEVASTDASSQQCGRPASNAVAVPKADFNSFLDEAPVEACLEYLTRPHHSWDSASKAMEMRRERVAEHEASVLARSFAFSRRSSMLSSFSATNGSVSGGIPGMAGLMNSSFASVNSVASAPAGFPRSGKGSGSKVPAGTLRKSGRLVGPTPTPAALIGSGIGNTSTSSAANELSQSLGSAFGSSGYGASSIAGVPTKRQASVGVGAAAGRPLPLAKVSGGSGGARSMSRDARRTGQTTKSAAKGKPLSPPQSSLSLVVGGSSIAGVKGSAPPSSYGSHQALQPATAVATGTAAVTPVPCAAAAGGTRKPSTTSDNGGRCKKASSSVR